MYNSKNHKKLSNLLTKLSFSKYNYWIPLIQKVLTAKLVLLRKSFALLFQKHFQVAIQNSEQHIIRIMEEFGAPGMAVAVSIDGVTVWKQGTFWVFIHSK